MQYREFTFNYKTFTWNVMATRFLLLTFLAISIHLGMSQNLKGSLVDNIITKNEIQIIIPKYDSIVKEYTVKENNSKLSNGAYGIDLNNFIDGFYAPTGGTRLNNVTVPVKGGFIKLDQMQITSSEATKALMYSGFTGGENPQNRTDGSVFRSYNASSAKNPNATIPIQALMIAVPEKYFESFIKSY